MTGRSNPTPPSSGSGSGTPITNPIVACPLSQSEILLVDEIGLPFSNVSVTIRWSDGSMLSTTTGADGRICFSKPPGSGGEVTLTDTHEARQGDSTTTPSGQHFAANSTGP